MVAGGGTDLVAGGSAIALPKGGGAVGGLGETFVPDLFTGTGNYRVPIELPPGRLGLAPELALGYSTGHGNGPFGLGWTLTLPGVARKTSRGVPRYAGDDTFVLSGAEDLVPVAGAPAGRQRYRPRTEGLFARIERVRDATGDHWEVTSRDGLRSRYGTPRPDPAPPSWRDRATIRRPDSDDVFAWRITGTVDPLGNRVRYTYLTDHGQPLVARIEYADYGDRSAPSFLVGVEFEYEPRPDPFSDHRAGFEVRTSLRCRLIRLRTHAADGVGRTVREYRLSYEPAAFNGASLLTRIEAVGIDGTEEERLPPVTFGYTRFDPAGRRFTPLTGGLPHTRFSDPDLALVDLNGNGLPDLVELGTANRYWTNRGGGRFDVPRSMVDAPPHALSEPGLELLDANGDGRADLVTGTGFYPHTFGNGWSRRSFRPYRQVPSVALDDPAVRLVDLDGDGLTDVVHAGTRLAAWFNDADPRLAWGRTARTDAPFDLADPQVRLADMTGDGLQDMVLLRSGTVVYRPNLGHGRWGAPVQMRNAPRLPHGYDPRRLLLGDVDGDGAADLVYVDRGRVLLWGNRTGNAWTEQPVTITGTPDVADSDDLRLTDLHGTGMAGLLFSSDRHRARFLDFNGGCKAHLLSTIDNHVGARITVRYQPSTAHFRRDDARPATRWRTTLPMPVHVVDRVEVVDEISQGRLVTEYRYRHGYWDGVEREFRGFAMVEQLDAQVRPGRDDSPPVLTRTWFHVGPVAAVEADDWVELDLRHEYWNGDPPMLDRPAAMRSFLAGLPRAARRDAIRAMRGQPLRTEVYAVDGTDRADRPYTVTESLPGVREEGTRIYFPFTLAQRTTQWERGDEPKTQLSFLDGYDAYGFATKQLTVGVPRGGGPYLAVFTTTGYARRDDADHYLVDRVARQSGFEVRNDGRTTPAELRDAVFAGTASLTSIGDSRTFYDGPEYVGLPLGRLGEYGLPVRIESLAFTEEFLADLGVQPSYLDPDGAVAWPAEYPADFRALLPAFAGYAVEEGGYYVASARHRYDVHDPARTPRGLTLSSLDALGNEVRVEHDAHDLLPVRMVDAAGLVTEAAYDLRLLQPRQVTDPNGNTGAVEFSPAGLVTAQYARGKNGEGDADSPSIRMEYDLLAFADRRQPVSVRTIRRAFHDTELDVPPAERDEVLVSVEYSDGVGRTLQLRTQAEDTLFADDLPADQSVPVGPGASSTGEGNVVVSGWQVYDNKGRVVEKYEPFFDTGWAYTPPSQAQLGQKSTIFYDPRGTAIRTVRPDGSEERVVLGVPLDLTDPDAYTPTPWEAFTYDPNDNAGRTHADLADGYQHHWNTPGSIETDAFGRTVRAVDRNGADAIVTVWQYDVQGHLVAVTDALGREAFRYRVDLLGRRWRVDSIDAGRRITVPDALGSTVERRDGRGALTLTAYDVLHRPSHVWARDVAAGPLTLRQRIEYGDAGNPGQPAAERAAAKARNLLGRTVRHYDEAGLVTVNDVDFKGNVVDSVRRMIADAVILADPPYPVDWAAPGDPLETTAYQTGTRYDALGRVVRQLLPADVAGQRHVVRSAYNRGGELERLLLDDTAHVGRIAYNARGQRTLVEYGNGVATRYAYEPRTFRIARVRSERGGEVLQDFAYEYDLVGNLLTIRDRTPGCGLPVAPDALDRRFTYDPVYRLLTATGRETDTAPDSPPWTDTPRGTDVTKTRAYRETYTYDATGSLRLLVHASAAPYTRDFALDPASTRLRRLTDGATPYEYTYDANGNLRTEATNRRFDWDHADRLVAFTNQVGTAEPSVRARYLYDAAGERVKKLVRRQGGKVEVTHYVGAFEHHRWDGGANNHVHVMDDTQRVALVRTGPAHPRDKGPAVQYHLTDHLRSSNVVLDGTGALVNREESTPYGDVSFGSFTRKRYRFVGRERDEESGLSRHGARYYAPYLCRWTSTDPAGPVDGIALYRYARANPMKFVDTGGRDSSNEIDPAIRNAQRQRDAQLDRYNKLIGIAAEGDNGQKAAAARNAYWKWHRELQFLTDLKAVHEKQSQPGVALSYYDYPVTQKDPVTGKKSKDNPWFHSTKRDPGFKGTGEQEGSFCLGTSRSMALRTTFGLDKQKYVAVLTGLKTRAEAAKAAGDDKAEAEAIISRIVSHVHRPGGLEQFNADIEARYGLKDVKFKDATYAEAIAALKAGAPVVANIAGGSHWVMVNRSESGALWQSDPLAGATSGGGLVRITHLEGSRFEIIVSASTGKVITPSDARSHEKAP